MRTVRDKERAARIVAAREGGETLKAIAQRESISTTRVGQILLVVDPDGESGRRKRHGKGAALYRWREMGMKWIDAAREEGLWPDLPVTTRTMYAYQAARYHARTNDLPFPPKPRS